MMGLGGPPTAEENGVPTIRNSFVLGSFAIREESDEELDEIEKMMNTSFNVTDIYAPEDRADDFDVSLLGDGMNSSFQQNMSLEDGDGEKGYSRSVTTNTSNRRRRSSVESSGLSAEETPTSRRRRSTATDSDDGPPSSASTPPSAPNFAGGERRRRGSIGRRLRQRTSGGGLPDRRMTVSGSTVDASLTSGETWQSLVGSFGAGDDNSLASFTSTSSFVQSGQKMEVGNLVFATDADMAEIMYGSDESGDAVSREGSNLQASLPPSAMLGTGAFSTVRLAWRKVAEGTELTAKAKCRSTFNGTADSQPKAGQTSEKGRSVVRVGSRLEGPDDRGELVAVKIIQKSILKQMKQWEGRLNVVTAYDNIEREIATMKRLRHPNVVRLYEVIDSMESRLLIVLEYVSLGEILSHVDGTNKYTRTRYRSRVKGLNTNGYFDEKSSARYFSDILHGLAYLHRNRIAHRDLKPENILLCESGVAKISDFGVAYMFKDEEDDRQSFVKSVLEDDFLSDSISGTGDVDDSSDRSDGAHLSKKERESALNMSAKKGGMIKRTEGTYCFWSPEMCRIDVDGSGFSAYAADMWAAGVCLFIFASGRLPFFSLSPSNLFESIIKADVPYDEVHFSENLVDILNMLLTKDPVNRAGVGDCLKHDFCVKAREERFEQIGDSFNESLGHIILCQDDVKNALSITAPQHRRVSAPNIVSRFWKLPSFKKLYNKVNK